MPRPPSLSNLSIAQLQSIIEARKGAITRLERQRAKLARKLHQLDSRIESLGGSPRGPNGAGGRVKNTKSLPEMLVTVLSKSGKVMGVGDIADAVRAGG